MNEQQAPDMGFDVAASVEVLEAGNIDRDFMYDDNKVSKFNEVVEFFKPFENKGQIIRQVLSGKAGFDKIDLLHQYVGLKKKALGLADELNKTAEELRFFE